MRSCAQELQVIVIALSRHLIFHYPSSWHQPAVSLYCDWNTSLVPLPIYGIGTELHVCPPFAVIVINLHAMSSTCNRMMSVHAIQYIHCHAGRHLCSIPPMYSVNEGLTYLHGDKMADRRAYCLGTSFLVGRKAEGLMSLARQTKQSCRVGCIDVW